MAVATAPAASPEILPIENGTGVFYNGARAYKRQTQRWRPAGPEPISDTFAMTATTLKTAELDVRRMRLPELGTIDATIDTDSRLTLRLRGSFGAATSVTVNGQPQPTNADGTTVALVLPTGTSHLRVTQPAPIALTPSCTSREVTVRAKAPRGDRLRVVRAYVNGKPARTVRGRAAGRAIRIAAPGVSAHVTVRHHQRGAAAGMAPHLQRLPLRQKPRVTIFPTATPQPPDGRRGVDGSGL